MTARPKRTVGSKPSARTHVRTKVTTGSGNVFADIGIPNAIEHETKADLVRLISNLMKARKLSQNAAAEVLGIGQPDISKMLRGQFRLFTVDRLLRFLTKLGQDVNIVVKESDKPQIRVTYH